MSAKANVISINVGRPGFYLAVLKEGDVGAGDAIELVSRDTSQVTVAASAQR